MTGAWVGDLQLAGAAPEAQAQALAQLRDGLAAQRKENAPAGPTKELHSAVSRLGKVRPQPEPGGGGVDGRGGSQSAPQPACTAFSAFVRQVLQRSECGSNQIPHVPDHLVLSGCILLQDSLLMALLVSLTLSSK